MNLEKQKTYTDIERVWVVQEICMLTAPAWDSKQKRMKNRMSIMEACEKVGIAAITYHKWLQKDPKLAHFVDELKQSQRRMVSDLSENIIFAWLSGETKLSAQEKIKLAQWTLEKTAKEYNPASKVEVESKVLNIDMSEKEIIERLKELNINNTTYEQFPEATYVEESEEHS